LLAFVRRSHHSSCVRIWRKPRSITCFQPAAIHPETSACRQTTRTLTGERQHLDEAIRAVKRGFYLRNDYYNGINLGFLLNQRAAAQPDPAEAIADFVQARRVRREVLAICERWLETNPEPGGTDSTQRPTQPRRRNA
jgi:hypothetical protein